MRTFFVIVLLLIVGLGIAAYALGWFSVTVDSDKIKQDRDRVLGLVSSFKEHLT